MLTVSSPIENSTVPNESFTVSGTCSSDHRVTVTLTLTSTGQFHNSSTIASQGGWSTTVSPWAEGPYNIKVTCDGTTNPITVNLTVGSPGIAVDPPSGP